MTTARPSEMVDGETLLDRTPLLTCLVYGNKVLWWTDLITALFDPTFLQL